MSIDRTAAIDAAIAKNFPGSEQAAKVSAEKVVKQPEVVKETPVEEASEEVADDVVETEESEDTTTETDVAPDAKALLESGDTKGAFMAAFGKPPSYFNIDDSKWAAFRKKEKDAWAEIDTEKAKVGEKIGQLSKAEEYIKKEYGEVLGLAKLGKSGDVVSAVTYAAKTLGLDVDELIRAYVTNVKKIDPIVRKRQLEGEPETKPAAKEETKTAPKDDQIKEAVDYITEKLEDHDVSKLRGYGKLVFEEIAKVKKATGKVITEEAAANRIIDRKKKEAASLNFIEPEKKSNKQSRRQPAGKKDTSSKANSDRALTRDELIEQAWKASFKGGKK